MREAKARVSDGDERHARLVAAQESSGSIRRPRAHLRPTHGRAECSLGEEKADTDDRGRRVSGGEDGLASGGEENEAALAAEKEEEQGGAHELGVELSRRLTKVKSIHFSAIAEASRPAEEGAVATHEKEHRRHGCAVAPVKENIGRETRFLGTLEERHPDVDV